MIFKKNVRDQFPDRTESEILDICLDASAVTKSALYAAVEDLVLEIKPELAESEELADITHSCAMRYFTNANIRYQKVKDEL